MFAFPGFSFDESRLFDSIRYERLGGCLFPFISRAQTAPHFPCIKYKGKLPFLELNPSPSRRIKTIYANRLFFNGFPINGKFARAEKYRERISRAYRRQTVDIHCRSHERAATSDVIFVHAGLEIVRKIQFRRFSRESARAPSNSDTE